MEKATFWLQKPSKQKFLVVDDEAFFRESLKEYLEGAGYQCEVAANGKEALEKISSNGPFTIVITDIVMPEMDGLTLIREVKKRWPEIDLIAITGHAKEVKYTDVIRAGASDFVRKPFDFDELEAKIARILKERELREQLRALTIRDPLTGIFNRRYFEEKLPEECYRAWRQNYPLHLVMFDIDHFKQYNDSYGHQAGDELLRRFANIILSSTRRYIDLPFRYGGDEFALLIPHCDTAGVCKIVSRILNRYQAEGFEPTTLSAGVARFIRREDVPLNKDVDDLILRADEALYEAKRRGGNCLVIDPKTKSLSLP
ncbi:MAG: diguanylate cyclase [Thermodesulfobacteria bacterium]|nr:diguanylate cyclase [Thermodesulfobacteriota bacterium]